MTWDKFKEFFLKNLRDSWVFVDDIWNKLKKTLPISARKDTKLDGLSRISTIYFKFDNTRAPEEFYLIYYFLESFGSSTRAQIKQWGQKRDTWTKIVKKAVNNKAKAGFLPTLFIEKID